MTIRTQVKAGGVEAQHNQALKVRSTLKAGGVNLNHSEALQVHGGERRWPVPQSQ